MKNQSLASQFRRTFVRILTASAIGTVLTYAIVFYLFTKSLDRDIYTPDYYERQVPGIEAYIRETNLDLLSQSEEAGLKSTIPDGGMLYLVVDENGSILYGSNPRKPFETKEELFHSFAGTTVFRHGHYIYTVPLLDNNGNTAGAVLLSYQIKTTFANNRGKLVFAALILALCSPFLYIIGFTLLYSRVFARKINQPLQLLIDASKKIQEKDLDFEIDYHSDNELGRLCLAFSEMKEELQNSLSAQWKMEQERVEIVAALSHDLKSPLSIILGYTDALLKNNSTGDEKLCRYLSVIRENAKKSAALVQEIQYSSGLETSDIQPHLVPVSLPDFLTQKVHEFELQAGQKDIKMVLEMQGYMENTIWTDSEWLSRIFDNIISNSLRYPPAGGSVHITIKAEKERITYKICDSGSGFSPKDLNKALNKFYRGDESRQSGGGHSGLGLYIVRQLVEQLGGTVRIENTKTGGACVMFWHKVS